MMQGQNIMVVIGLVMIAISFVIFPIVIEGADEIRGAANVSDYTGLESIVEVGPTLVFVGLLFGGVMTTFFGIRGMRSKGKK